MRWQRLVFAMIGLLATAALGRVWLASAWRNARAVEEREVPAASLARRGTGEGYLDPLHVSIEAAPEGSLVLEVPDDGRSGRVEAESNQASTTNDGVPAGTSGSELDVSESGVLVFRFRDAQSGEILSASNFDLAWRPAGGRDYAPVFVYLGSPPAPDPEGWYRLELPTGPADLQVVEMIQHVGYLPFRAEAALLSTDRPLEMEFVMRRGLELELRLDPEAPLLPKGHVVVFVEDEYWAKVRPVRGVWESGGLGRALSERFVTFDESRAVTIRGLAPGRFRFKVFPDDLVVEPAEVIVGEESREPAIVRWHLAR